MLVRQVLDRLQITGLGQFRARRLHHDRRHLAAMLLEQILQHVQVAVGKGYGRAGENARNPGGINVGKGVLTAFRVHQVVRRLVPVVPAVVAAEKDLVLVGGSPGDAHRHRAGLAAALGIAHHFGAGYGGDQLFGQLDLLRIVDRVDTAAIDLLLDRRVHHLVGVAQNHGADGVDPVDVLVAVHVDKARSPGALGIDRVYPVGQLARPAADQLGPPRNDFAGAFVELHGARNFGKLGHGRFLSICDWLVWLPPGLLLFSEVPRDRSQPPPQGSPPPGSGPSGGARTGRLPPFAEFGPPPGPHPAASRRGCERA